MRQKAKRENKHMIGNMRVTTTSNSLNEVPEVLIYKIDFDFNGNTTINEYEQLTEHVYKYMFKKYPQDKKIINVDIPELTIEGEVNRFNKRTHHCSIEVYLRNEQETPYDEWMATLIADDIKPICKDIETLFWKFGFMIKVSVKRTKKVEELFG